MPRRKSKTMSKDEKTVNIVKYGNYRKGCGGIYGLGFLGAAIYYLQTSTGFWSGVLGILKAIVWPAFLVHKLLGM